MHSGLYHSVVSNCHVNHNCYPLQYSLDFWSLDFLHIHNRALFDLHQTPNLDSNDRKFHCDSPLEYDFEQCTVALQSSVLSAILFKGILMANHLFLFEQFLVDHLHSKGVHNKMHRQQSWHVIDQDYWMSLDTAWLLLVQWDYQSSLKCDSIGLIYQRLVVICHWILPHEDMLNNNKNEPMPMLDPCKNVHVEIQQLVYQDQLFYRV